MTKKARTKRPLLTRMIVLYSLITVAIVGLITAVVFFAQIDTINENFINRLRVKLYLLDDHIRSQAESDNLFESISTKLEEQGFDSFAILSDNYLKPIVAKNNSGSAATDNRMVQLAISKLSFGGEYLTFYVEDDTFYSYLPFNYQDNIYVLKTIRAFSEVEETLYTIYKNSLIVGVVILIANLLFAFWVYWVFFSRINKIEEAARKVREGDYSIHVHDKKQDELSLVVTTMNDMIRTIDSSISEARGMNPLSGLPGNISIEKEVHRRIEEGEIFGILYSDLDNFKAYNDKYGFTKGDDVILYARDVFIEAKSFYPFDDIFLGHEGGDDFVAVAPYSMVESLAKRICNIFDEKASQFYSIEDQEQGYIVSKDRQGNTHNFPIVSFSIAVLTNKHQKVSKIGEFDVGLMKSAVKKMENRPPGSAYLMDRRKDDR